MIQQMQLDHIGTYIGLVFALIINIELLLLLPLQSSTADIVQPVELEKFNIIALGEKRGVTNRW